MFGCTVSRSAAARTSPCASSQASTESARSEPCSASCATSRVTAGIAHVGGVGEQVEGGVEQDLGAQVGERGDVGVGGHGVEDAIGLRARAGDAGEPGGGGRPDPGLHPAAGAPRRQRHHLGAHRPQPRLDPVGRHPGQDRVHPDAVGAGQRAAPVGGRLDRDDVGQLRDAHGVRGGGGERRHHRRGRRIEPVRAGHQLGRDPAGQQPGDQVGAGGAAGAPAHQVPGGDPGGPEQRLLGPRGERDGALLHPDRAQPARAGVDAGGQPAADPQLGVLVDAHDALAGADPVEHAPLAQQPQVVGRPLPAEHREPAQLVGRDAVGAGVGEHPAAGVLDAHQPAGEQPRRLGQREQLAGAGVGLQHLAGELLDVVPAGVVPDGDDGGPARGAAQQLRVRPARLDGDGDGAAPVHRAHGGQGVAPTCADDQHEPARVVVGLVVGIDDGEPGDRRVQAAGVEMASARAAGPRGVVRPARPARSAGSSPCADRTT